jgi:serine/threonine-protein kinase
MELDDLKSAWQSLERKLDRQHALELQHFRTGRLASARRGLWPLVAGQVGQAAIGFALMGWIAPYWVEHWGEWHLVAYGVALHLYGLMIALFAGRDLVHIAQVDYAAPVLEIQKRLASLRAQRIQAARAFAIAGSFAWIPLVLVVFQKLGADLWVHKPAMVAWFVASGFGTVLSIWALAAWSRLARNAKLRKDLDDHAAGRSLTRAQAVLDEIARFEQD